jgi:hypothetical protein
MLLALFLINLLNSFDWIMPAIVLPLGTLVAFSFGGWLSEQYGWRVLFWWLVV